MLVRDGPKLLQSDDVQSSVLILKVQFMLIAKGLMLWCLRA